MAGDGESGACAVRYGSNDRECVRVVSVEFAWRRFARASRRRPGCGRDEFGNVSEGDGRVELVGERVSLQPVVDLARFRLFMLGSAGRLCVGDFRHRKAGRVSASTLVLFDRARRGPFCCNVRLVRLRIGPF